MKYFSIQELTKSATAVRKGIKNDPSIQVCKALTALIENVLDPLREAYGKPIIVTSGYRCEKLNKAVGGAASSQHVKGEAADIRSVQDTPEENKKLFDLIVKLKLPFDQLINEYGYDWVHVSFGARHRRQKLKAVKKNGRTTYIYI
ncbi:MAG: peptidase M15 [Prevotella sp.]|nr:peptidase M15 [Prevotella sp.]